jgi:hypothetical protein
MTQKDILFIRAMFAQRFNFMDNWQRLWDKMKDDIVSDIEDTASKDFHSGDVDMAIARTLAKRLL